MIKLLVKRNWQREKYPLMPIIKIKESYYKTSTYFLFNVISKTKSFKTPLKSSKTSKFLINKTKKNTWLWKEKFFSHWKSSLNPDSFISNFIKSSSISMVKTLSKMVFVLSKWEKIKAPSQIINKQSISLIKESKSLLTKGTKTHNMSQPFMSL